MDLTAADCQNFLGSPDSRSGSRVGSSVTPQYRRTSLGNNGRDVLRREITRKLQALPHLRDVANKIAPIRFATVPQLHQIAEAIGLGEIAVAIGEADQAQRRIKKKLGTCPPKRRSSGGRSDVNIKEAICDSLLAYKWASAGPGCTHDSGMQVINRLLTEGSRRLPDFHIDTQSSNYLSHTSSLPPRHDAWSVSPSPPRQTCNNGTTTESAELPLDATFIEAASMANREVVQAVANASTGNANTSGDKDTPIQPIEMLRGGGADNWSTKCFDIIASQSSSYSFSVDGSRQINGTDDDRYREYNYRDYSVMRQIPSLSTSLLLDIKHRNQQDHVSGGNTSTTATTTSTCDDQSSYPVFRI